MTELATPSSRSTPTSGPMLPRYVEEVEAPICYLRGPGGMVKAMRAMLGEGGDDENDIRTEEFTGYWTRAQFRGPPREAPDDDEK